MLLFVHLFAMVFLAALLLTSGLAHAWQPSELRRAVASHGIVPPRFASLAVIVVTLGELALAAALLATPWRGSATLTFAACAAIGTVFLVYVRRLLRTPQPAATCGCSPLASPVSYASLLPAGALLAVSIVGMLSIWLEPSPIGLASALAGQDETVSRPVVFLPVVWALTMTGLVWLIPATVGLEEA